MTLITTAWDKTPLCIVAVVLFLGLLTGLAVLVSELRTSVSAAKKNLNKGIRDAEAVLKELRSRDVAAAPHKKVASQ